MKRREIRSLDQPHRNSSAEVSSRGKMFISFPLLMPRWIDTLRQDALSNHSWTESLCHPLTHLSFPCVCVCAGTSVMQVTATDADDPTYGNSARLVYSILQGQPYFSVEPQTGEAANLSLVYTQLQTQTNAASHALSQYAYFLTWMQSMAKCTISPDGAITTFKKLERWNHWPTSWLR